MMDYRRGWCHLELAYGDVLQRNLLWPGGPLVNVELPLFFLDRADAELPRTAWNSLRDRGQFHLPSDGDPVGWAANQIHQFLRREQSLALNMAKVITGGQPVHEALAKTAGLVGRVTEFDPVPIR